MKHLILLALCFMAINTKAQNIVGNSYKATTRAELGGLGGSGFWEYLVLNFVSKDSLLIEKYDTRSNDGKHFTLTRHSSYKSHYTIIDKAIQINGLKYYSNFALLKNGDIAATRHLDIEGGPKHGKSLVSISFQKFKGYKKGSYTIYEPNYSNYSEIKQENAPVLSGRKQKKLDKKLALLTRNWRGGYCAYTPEQIGFDAINGDFQRWLHITKDSINIAEFSITNRGWRNLIGTWNLDEVGNMQIHFTTETKIKFGVLNTYQYDNKNMETQAVDIKRTYSIDYLTENRLMLVPLKENAEYNATCFVIFTDQTK
jgi:hypothetical protein